MEPTPGRCCCCASCCCRPAAFPNRRHTPPARPLSTPPLLQHPHTHCSKRNGHAEAVKREVEVLRRLRGCLNVASLEAVFEDDSHVHLVLEYCKGGELAHRIGETHYSGGCCLLLLLVLLLRLLG